MPKQHDITEQSLGSAAAQQRQLRHSWNGEPLTSSSIARYSSGPTGKSSAVLVELVEVLAGDPVHTHGA